MTIRDTINRQKESRESAERAKQERFAKAEAEALAAHEAEIAAKVKAEAGAKARVEAKEEARLQAIADAKAQKIAEELAKATAIEDAKAAIEAGAKALVQAKLQAKADAKAQKQAEKQAEKDATLQAKAESEAHKQAQLDAKLQAKAEAEAQKLAQQEARAKAAAAHQALVLAEEKARQQAEALAKEKARLEAEALAKEKNRLEAEAVAKAEASVKELAKIQAKQDAQAKAAQEAKAKAAAKEETARQALVLAKEKTRLEAEALAKENARLESEALAKEKIRLKAEAVAKAEAGTKELAKIQAKEDAKAIVAQEAKAKAAAKVEATLKAKQSRLAKADAKAAKAAHLASKAREEADHKAKAKADAKAAKEASLIAKAKQEALVLEAKKAEDAVKAQAQAQARAIAKAEVKEKAREKAREKALLKAQKRSEVWINIKIQPERKVKYLFHLLIETKEHIRPYFRQIATIYSKLNLRRFAGITYSIVIVGVVVLMTQVFMERYPQTSNPDIVYELPIDPELAVIESPEHTRTGEGQVPLAVDGNLTVMVTSSVAVVAPPKQKPLPDTAITESEPEADLTTKLNTELTIAPSTTSVATLANWQINAVESDIPASSPRLVVVIDDIGMSTAVSQKLAKLPAPLTLAFLPYATRLGYQSRLVASYGHELLVHMPMAPKSLTVNPGNNALLDDLDKVEFERRLNWNLSRFTGFIGINNHMGSSLTEHTKEMRWVMAELKSRGLVFLDSVTTSDSVAASQAQLAGVPTLSRNVFLDNVRDQAAILKQLKRAMRMSQRRGLSIAIGHPYPETIAVLKEWLPKLKSEGIILTPLSAAISEKYFPKTMLAAKDVPSLARAK